MAEYDWGSEKAKIKLGQPYLFTESQYEYCKTRNAPIAVIYYDTKTSAASKELYASIFESKENVKALWRRLSSYKLPDPETDKYKGGYCCLLVLDRCGNISEPTQDQRYFTNELLKQNDLQFPVLALYYDGRTYCHELPRTPTVDSLADAIYEKCESLAGGLERFSEWHGRQDWLDHQPHKPEQEVKPDKTGLNNLNRGINDLGLPAYWEDVPATKSYTDYDRDYSGNFNGIPRISSRPGVSWLLNLADVSTPETTYMLIGSFDYKNPNVCTWGIGTALLPYVKNCDNVKTLKNGECCGGGYANLFKEGIRYRYFIFYEFSHGNYESVTIDTAFSYAMIWEYFKNLNAQQRVWGMFDSCHSGSMIRNNDVRPRSFSAKFLRAEGVPSSSEEPKEIIEYLEEKFNRRSTLMPAVTGGAVTAAEAAATYNPRMMLWSSTGSHSYGWYSPGSSTNFTNGFNNAMSKTYGTYWKNHTYSSVRYGWASDDMSNGQQAFKKIQECGHEVHGDDTLNTAIPQCRNYPENGSPETTIIFY